MKEKLLNALKDIYEIEEKNIVEEKQPVNNLTLFKLRDSLIIIGKIISEDIENQIYVAEVNVGVASLAKALLVVHLSEEYLYMISYAEEGIIKQNLAKKAITNLEVQLKDYIKDVSLVTTGQRKTRKYLFGIISLLFMGGIVVGLINYVKIDSYNQAVMEFNEVVEKYSSYAEKTAIYNISGLPLELDKKEFLNNNIFDYFVAVIKGNFSFTMRKNVEQIDSEKKVLQSKIKIMDQITNPDEGWILERLDSIKDISEIQAVTKVQDPTGLMGKVGGTTACVYFSVTDIDQDTVPGQNVVEKGTDCGGCIEVYEDLISAEARCDYLQQFDGTLLYSGSYAVVGTMVIRISYQLSSVRQLELTDIITHEFTKVANE